MDSIASRGECVISGSACGCFCRRKCHEANVHPISWRTTCALARRRCTNDVSGQLAVRPIEEAGSPTFIVDFVSSVDERNQRRLWSGAAALSDYSTMTTTTTTMMMMMVMMMYKRINVHSDQRRIRKTVVYSAIVPGCHPLWFTWREGTITIYSRTEGGMGVGGGLWISSPSPANTEVIRPTNEPEPI